MFAKYPLRVCGRKRQDSRPDRASMRARESNVPSQVSHATFKSFCNLRKSFECDLLFRPFDVADVVSRQISLLRQLLLAETSLFSPSADSFSQNAINSARERMHSFLSNQNLKTKLPTIGWYLFNFFPCHLLAMGIEHDLDFQKANTVN